MAGHLGRGGDGREERGAVLVLVAVVVALCLLVAAFAVDLGMQRVVRRDLQALADVAAFDLARELDGRARSEYGTSLDPVLAATLSRNDDVLGDQPELSYELGRVSPTGGFAPVGAEEVPNAVRVRADGAVDFAIAGGSGRASRAAVASAEKASCFRVGSYAAGLSSNESAVLRPLLALLGGQVGLTVLDLQGLAAVDVRLLDLFGAEGLGLDVDALDWDSLLGAEVTLSRLFLATADVLRRDTGRVAEIDLLQRLAQVNLPHLDLTLASLVEIDTAGRSALDAEVNLLDLVAASLFLANGTNLLGLDAGLGFSSADLLGRLGGFLNTLGVLGVTADLPVSLGVGQRPVLYCGTVDRVEGYSSQVQLRVGNPAAGSEEVVVKIAGTTVALNLDLSLDLTPVRARLRDVVCGADGRSVRFDAVHGLLDLDLEVRLRVATWDPANVVPDLISAPFRIKVTPAGASTSVSVPWAPGSFETPGLVGQGDGLPVGQVSITTAQLTALGIPIGIATSWLVDRLLAETLNWLIAGLNTTVLAPLLRSLGLEVAGGRIHLAPTPDCGVPVLRG